MVLSNEEKVRYSRHLNLPQFGIETQEKLKDAKVLVVGTGGLGAPMLQYLTAAGVGTIGVVDFDTVDASNLQRQVLFDTNDIGQLKTSIAIQKLKVQNPNVTFIEFNEALTSFNAKEIIKDFDVVADGTDNFPTRYLVNDACVLMGKTNVYASIFQFEGQVSVFNYHDGESYGPNYRDLFPTPPPPGMVPSCAEGGVIGVLPGIVGSIQASEVIKVLTGVGNPLAGRLFLFDALDFSCRVMNVRKDPDNPLNGDNPSITELIDYDEFCGLNYLDKTVSEISVQELKEWKEKGKTYALIDVREPYEYETSNIGGELIPHGEIANHLTKIPKDLPIVIHCKSGVRSEKAIRLLQEKYGYHNLHNLKGGISAWKSAFDPDMIVV
jgi:molybdopterin/thiamine biosynthesis adenylyltransferase/rhodanese-related sulfurtransferase